MAKDVGMRHDEEKTITILTEGCCFSGKIVCMGMSRIGGKVDGQILSHGQLIIDDTATLLCDISGDVIEIYGKVKGNIHAKTRITLHKDSMVEGSLVTPNLISELGAVIEAHVQMKCLVSSSLPNPTKLRKHDDVPPIKIAG